MVKLLFMLSIIAIPFSDVPTLLPLGEMEHELSAYMFLITFVAAIAFSLRESSKAGASRYLLPQAHLLPKFMWLMMGVIFISFAMNFPSMLGDTFRGRYAPVKFMTSTMVIMYGFGIAYLSYFMGQRYDWHRIVIRPVAISVIISLLVSAVEMLSWDGGVTSGLYAVLYKLFHAGSAASAEKGFLGGAFGWGYSEGRVRGVSFEPPALANYAGFAWPWIYAGFSGSRGARKLLYFFLWIGCSALMLVAASRTGLVMLAGNFLVLLMLRFVYLPPTIQKVSLSKMFTFGFWCLAVIAVIFVIINHDNVVSSIVASNSISNLSRYASMTTAFRMFADTPIWGYGFGQYGFHVLEYMPSWGYYSWEIRAWFTDPMVIWPPVFSMYGRLASETGLLGLGAWIGIWYWLARNVIQSTLEYQRVHGVLLLRSYPLVISCFCVLLSGIPSDTMRTSMMWVSMGLACCYLGEVRARTASSARARLQVISSADTQPASA